MRRLSARMALASAVVAIVLAAVLVVLLVAIRDQRDAARDARRASGVVDAAQRVSTSIVIVYAGASGYFIGGDDSFLRPVWPTVERLPSELRDFERAAAAVPELRSGAQALGRDSRTIQNGARAVLLASRRGLPAARAVVGRAIFRPTADSRRLNALRSRFADFIAHARGMAAARNNRSAGRASTALIAGAVGLVVSVGLVLMFALYLSRSVVHPVRRVASAARSLASGDFSSRVPPPEGDSEIDELGRSFNAMAVSIEERRLELSGAVSRLEDEKDRMARYLAFGQRISLETEPEHLGPVVLDELMELSGAHRGALYAVDPESADPSRLLAAREMQAGPATPREGSHPREDGGEELVSPMLHGGRAVALLVLVRLRLPFDEEALRRVGDLARQAAAGLASSLALEAARNRSSVIRAVLDATPDAIALLDDRGHPVFENPPMTIVRRALVESVRRPGGGYRTNVTAEGNDPDAEVRDELELLGTQRTFARYGAPVRGLDGRRIGRLVVLREVTREREADRMKEEFFGLVSHELRTPLTSILGYLELLVEDEEVQPDQRRYLEIALRNSRRLMRLVGDLLFVAQVEAGRLALEPGEVDLRQLAEEAVDAARPGAESKDIVISADTEVVPLTWGDRDRIGQVLDNLIANALKFTPEGGSVSVTLRARDGVAFLEVADTGPGITAEEQERLFDRFFRASSAVQQAVPGVGLGLTIAKAICEAHGGVIAVHSVPGEGAVFRVELPLREPRRPQVSEGVGSSPEPARSAEGRAPS